MEDSEKVFAFLQVAYGEGVLKKFMPVLGNALRRLLNNTGMRMDELLGIMDTAREETVEKAGKLLSRFNAVAKFLTNRRLLGLASRMLDVRVIRNALEQVMAWYLGRAVVKAQGHALQHNQ